MPNVRSLSLLRKLLFLDAATCTVMGAALTLGTSPIATLTAMPPALLLWAGLVLFPIAAFIVVVARQASPARSAVWLIVAGNLLWVAVSLGLLASGWIAPNAIGYAFVTVQAVAVGLMAALEQTALRRVSVAMAA